MLAWGEIDRSGLGHAPQSPFGGAVGNSTGGTAQAGDGGNIDDRASTRAFHQRDDGLHAEEGAELVDAHMLLEEGSVSLHQGAGPVDAGIVDQAVQAAHGGSGLDGILPIRFAGNVVAQKNRVLA